MMEKNQQKKFKKKKVDLNIDKHKILKESTNNTNIQKEEKKDDNKEPYQTDDIKKTVQNEISALSLSSIKLKKEVLNTKDKETEKEDKLSNEFDIKKLKLKWLEYSKKVSENGNNSLSSLLEISNPVIFQKNKIIYTVPSKSNKKEIDNDRENILKFLKKELMNDIIILEIVVDKSTGKEYYSTPQEKFDKLNKINPLLDQFKKDLKLDL